MTKNMTSSKERLRQDLAKGADSSEKVCETSTSFIPIEVTEVMDRGFCNVKALAKLKLSWLESNGDRE